MRQQYLDGALMTYGFGLVNERRYKTRGDRRGRPKGWRGQWVDDGEALKIMSDFNKKMGGRIPLHKLARLVVSSGRVPLNNTKASSVIRRLAVRYRAMQK